MALAEAIAEAPLTSPSRKRLLLASDCEDQSSELAGILENAGSVEKISVFDMPDHPASDFSGVVVDIDLTAVETVQRVRRKLTNKAYQALPRLFVLTNSLHHGSTQAWALGATDTIQRPFDPESILHRIRNAFPEKPVDERSTTERALSRGIAAALTVLGKIFDRLPAGAPLTLDDVMQEETQILKALKRSSLKSWLLAVNQHHVRTYRHTMLVTGYAVAFAQLLNMNDEDQRRVVRAALIHDVGKAFIPPELLDKPGELTDQENDIIANHTRLGFAALKKQGGFPGEVLDVVLHHHELLDGTGYPDGLHADRISDIVRIITLVDIFAMFVEEGRDIPPLTHTQAYSALENLGNKLDRALLYAFRPLAFGV